MDTKNTFLEYIQLHPRTIFNHIYIKYIYIMYIHIYYVPVLEIQHRYTEGNVKFVPKYSFIQNTHKRTIKG